MITSFSKNKKIMYLQRIISDEIESETWRLVKSQRTITESPVAIGNTLQISSWPPLGLCIDLFLHGGISHDAALGATKTGNICIY